MKIKTASVASLLIVLSLSNLKKIKKEKMLKLSHTDFLVLLTFIFIHCFLGICILCGLQCTCYVACGSFNVLVHLNTQSQ